MLKYLKATGPPSDDSSGVWHVHEHGEAVLTLADGELRIRVLPLVPLSALHGSPFARGWLIWLEGRRWPLPRNAA